MANIYHGKHCSNEFKCFTSFNPHLSFSCSVVSNFLWPHGLQHTRLPCPLLSLGACSNSCPLSQWCYRTISSPVASFSSSPQPFPESGCFPMSRLFASSGQITGAPVTASVLPVNIQDWFPLGLTGWISLVSWLEQKPGLPSSQKESLLPGRHSRWDIGFLLPFESNWSKDLSWIPSLLAFGLDLYHWVPSLLRPLVGLELHWLSWVSSLLTQPQVMGLVSLHNCLSQFLMISLGR